MQIFKQLVKTRRPWSARNELHIDPLVVRYLEVHNQQTHLSGPGQKGIYAVNDNKIIQENRYMRLRISVASIIGLAVAAYTVAILFGKIPGDQRIDAAHFSIIMFTSAIIILLLKPTITNRLKRFKGAGIEIEMLEQVKENQDKQGQVLDDISLILPLLLPQNERTHLMNLYYGRTANYRGNSVFRSEIRRLRSMGLIEMRDGRNVGHMKTGLEFDLAHYIKITKSGRRWIARIKQIEEHEQNAEES